MINKMIRAYVKKYENREYTQHVFGQLFEKTTNLKKYLKEIKLPKELSFCSDPEAETSSPNFEERLPGSSSFSTKSSEEIKLCSEENPSLENLSIGNIIIICNSLLDGIIKKLLYMPLSMRYLCKLVAILAQQEVIFINNS